MEQIPLSAFLHFHPQYENSVGSGRWLLESLVRPELEPTTAGASLEFSADPSASFRVSEGPFLGKSWRELAERFGEKILGRQGVELLERGLGLELRFLATENSNSPLLLFSPLAARIFSRDIPREGRGKFLAIPILSALLILETRGEAMIYYGRRKDLSASRFLGLFRRSPPEEILEPYPVEPGQVILIPAGLPYVLGQGILAYEVRVHPQKNGRRGESEEKSRRPHEGLLTAAVPFSAGLVEGLGYVSGPHAVTWLYATPWFCTQRLDLRGEWREEERSDDPSSFLALTGLFGQALLVGGTETETLGRGKTIIIPPASPPLRINPGAEGATVLRTWVPDHLRDIERPLLDRGFSPEEIVSLYGAFGKNAGAG